MGRLRGSKNKTVETYKATEILNSVKDVTLEGVSTKLAATQIEIQKTLADLNTKITQHLVEMNNIEEAKEIKKEELKAHYEIEVTAATLDDLKAEIEAQRKAWEEEQVNKQKEFLVQRQERELNWNRESEQYIYNKKQEYKKLDDEQANKLSAAEKTNKENNEKLEKAWAIREASIKEKEEEIVNLRKQVDEFPAKQKAEVDKNVAIATNSVKRDYETQIKIAAAESSTNQKLSDQKVDTLNKVISDLYNQITSLKEQLFQAQKDIKEVSTKALEASSGRETINNLQKALENIQSRPSK